MEAGKERDTPDEETTDWRAVCGRTARTVRRAGTAKAVSDPYRRLLMAKMPSNIGVGVEGCISFFILFRRDRKSVV